MRAAHARPEDRCGAECVLGHPWALCALSRAASGAQNARQKFGCLRLQLRGRTARFGEAEAVAHARVLGPTMPPKPRRRRPRPAPAPVPAPAPQPQPQPQAEAAQQSQRGGADEADEGPVTFWVHEESGSKLWDEPPPDQLPRYELWEFNVATGAVHRLAAAGASPRIDEYKGAAGSPPAKKAKAPAKAAPAKKK